MLLYFSFMFLSATVYFHSFNFWTNFGSVNTWDSPHFDSISCVLLEMGLRATELLAADTGDGVCCDSGAVAAILL
jgi:hypothetical protein